MVSNIKVFVEDVCLPFMVVFIPSNHFLRQLMTPVGLVFSHSLPPSLHYHFTLNL